MGREAANKRRRVICRCPFVWWHYWQSFPRFCLSSQSHRLPLLTMYNGCCCRRMCEWGCLIIHTIPSPPPTATLGLTHPEGWKTHISTQGLGDKLMDMWIGGFGHSVNGWPQQGLIRFHNRDVVSCQVMKRKIQVGSYAELSSEDTFKFPKFNNQRLFKM